MADSLSAQQSESGTNPSTVSDGAIGSLSDTSANVTNQRREVPTGMSDEDREQAICRAAALVEYLHALARFHEALWWRDGCFDHKAAFDVAYSSAHKAREVMESLIKQRSAAQVMRMERAHGLDRPACANE